MQRPRTLVVYFRSKRSTPVSLSKYRRGKGPPQVTRAMQFDTQSPPLPPYRPGPDVCPEQCQNSQFPVLSTQSTKERRPHQREDRTE
jgi:hypothetical protein